MISGNPAVRGMMDEFELGQLWTSGDNWGAVADKNWGLLRKHFKTTQLPLHVVVAPDATELARFEYTSTMTPDDYAMFLEAGMKAFEEWKTK